MQTERDTIPCQRILKPVTPAWTLGGPQGDPQKEPGHWVDCRETLRRSLLPGGPQGDPQKGPAAWWTTGRPSEGAWTLGGPQGDPQKEPAALMSPPETTATLKNLSIAGLVRNIY